MKKVNLPFEMFKLAANTNDNRPQKMQLGSAYIRTFRDYNVTSTPSLAL